MFIDPSDKILIEHYPCNRSIYTKRAMDYGLSIIIVTIWDLGIA
jgi:hypothetical protein